MRAYSYIVLFFIILFVFPSFSTAQVTYTENIYPTDEIALNPPYPQPGQTVTATIQVKDTNISTANIAWLLDNKVKQRQIGKNAFTFIVPNTDTPHTLGVLVTPVSGSPLARSVVLYPSTVTLVWEGDTYTPPFYRGRALYTPESTIRVEAMTKFRDTAGNNLPPSQLIYTWSKDGTVLGSQSGIGAYTLITSSPDFLGSYILSVVVQTKDGSLRVQSSAQITTSKPIIRLYKNDPLLGTLYNRALSNNTPVVSTQQIEIQAVPYFMNTSSENSPSLDYLWEVNGKKASLGNNLPSRLHIQFKSQKNISVNIKVVVTNILSLLQKAETTVTIPFVGDIRNSLFGL